MKRFFPAAVALILLLNCCICPAGASSSDVAALFPAIRSYQPFSDVGQEEWFSSSVVTCYETGLLNGKGGEIFAPHDTVTVAEAAAVAVRMHSLLHGGTGTPAPTPITQGDVKLVGPDGSHTVDFRQALSITQGAGVIYLQFDPQLLIESAAPEEIALCLEERTYLGELRTIIGGYLLDDDPWTGYVLEVPEDGHSLYEELVWQREKHNTFANLQTRWYQDTLWYLWMNPDFAEVAELATPSIRDQVISRNEYLSLLSCAIPASLLSPINHISTLPDIQDEQVLRFYQAGILTGVDQFGTFQGESPLTRAELAVITARIIRPSLRISFSPHSPAAESSK